MPISLVKAQRKNLPHSQVFRGDIDELEKLPIEEIKPLLKKMQPVRLSDEGLTRLAEQVRTGLVNLSRKMSGDNQQNQGREATLWKISPFTQYGFGFRLVRFKSGKILVHQAPVVHTLGENVKEKMNYFQSLLSVLRDGFKGQDSPNVFLTRHRRVSGLVSFSSDPDLQGDSYHLELLHPVKMARLGGETYGFVGKTPPSAILRVNIKLSDKADEAERTKRRAFYRKHLKGVPHGFI